MLTSGTTGTPKGAEREQPASLVPLGALLSMVPFRAGESTYIAAPMFHALGFAHTLLAVGLGSTMSPAAALTRPPCSRKSRASDAAPWSSSR